MNENDVPLESEAGTQLMIEVTSNQSPRLLYSDLEKFESFQCADKKCNKFPCEEEEGVAAITFKTQFGKVDRVRKRAPLQFFTQL